MTAGFDISKADIKLTANKLKVTIPEAKIQDVNVKAEDVEFYDTSISLIKADKEDTLKVLSEVEASARDYAKTSGLLEAANGNSVNIMKGLLKSVAGDREIEVDFK